MAIVHKWLLVEAKDKEEAKDFTGTFVDENVGHRCVFDEGGLDEAKEIMPLKEVWDELVTARELADEELKEHAKNFMLNCQMLSNGTHAWKREAGIRAGRIRSICLEEFCPDMPFYNGGMFDWSFPDEEARERVWAVPLELHY